MDVIFPLINVTGVGIPSATRTRWPGPLPGLHSADIGIYAMKPLGGGHLIADPREAFDYLRGLGTIDTICVGVQSEAELDVDICLVEGREPPAQALAETRREPRRPDDPRLLPGLRPLRGTLPQGALRLENGKCVCDQSKCVRCGYCAPVCEEFCIKVI